MPLSLHLGRLIKERGVRWIESLRKIGAKRTLAMLGLLGEQIIDEAFATGGWGSWAPLSSRTIRFKKSSAILIESAQMRKAVVSRVV